MSRLTVLLSLILLATLAACAAPTEPALTPTVPPTAAPTLTRTPRPPTYTPRMSPTPFPTPRFEYTAITDDFLFDGASSPDCQLPCWYGLRVGQSTEGETSAVIRNIFAFDERANLFSVERGSYRFYNQWDLDAGAIYRVTAAVNQDKDELATLSFFVLGSRFDTLLTPQRLIQNVGAPDQIFIKTGLTESGDIAFVDLLMIYENGLVFSADGALGTLYVLPGTISEDTKLEFEAELCLGGPRWANNPGRSIHIFPPLPTDPGERGAAPITELIERFANNEEFHSIQETRVSSMESVTALALADGDACIDGIPVEYD